MKNLFAALLANVAEFTANMGTSASVYFWFDEPKMPENLVK